MTSFESSSYQVRAVGIGTIPMDESAYRCHMTNISTKSISKRYQRSEKAGDGDHRGVVLVCLFDLTHQRGQQDPGRQPGAFCQAGAYGSLSLWLDGQFARVDHIVDQPIKKGQPT